MIFFVVVKVELSGKIIKLIDNALIIQQGIKENYQHFINSVYFVILFLPKSNFFSVPFSSLLMFSRWVYGTKTATAMARIISGMRVSAKTKITTSGNASELMIDANETVRVNTITAIKHPSIIRKAAG